MTADWQLPRGVSRSLWDYFHDPTIAQAYDATLEGTPLLHMDREFVLEHCRPAGKIIDLGCGTGRLAIALAQAGYQPIGVDLSLPMLRVLSEKATALGLQIPCVCGNLVELGMLADGSFDHAACLFSTLGLIVGAAARGGPLLMSSGCSSRAACSWRMSIIAGSIFGRQRGDACYSVKR